MLTVGSAVAAVSGFSSASAKKLTLSLPLLSLWVVKSDKEYVCEWVPAALRVNLSRVLSELR